MVRPRENPTRPPNCERRKREAPSAARHKAASTYSGRNCAMMVSAKAAAWSSSRGCGRGYPAISIDDRCPPPPLLLTIICHAARYRHFFGPAAEIPSKGNTTTRPARDHPKSGPVSTRSSRTFLSLGSCVFQSLAPILRVNVWSLCHFLGPSVSSFRPLLRLTNKRLRGLFGRGCYGVGSRNFS